MKVFPYILARIGGLPFGWIEMPVPEQYALDNALTQLTQLSVRENQVKEQLSQELLNFNQSTGNKEVRNLVQNFRRDFFNNRSISPAAREKLQAVLPSGLKEEIENYFITFVEVKSNLTTTLISLYEKALLASRSLMQTLAKEDAIHKGLVLSSHDLLQVLNDYTGADVKNFKRKEHTAEYSFYRYITRSATKTSPFSTFNNLALSTLTDGIPDNYSLEVNGTGQVISHVSFNSYLFKYLKDVLVQVPSVLKSMHIRQNPTLEQYDGQYVYICVTHIGGDDIRRVDMNAGNKQVLAILENTSESDFHTLANKYAAAADVNYEQASAYIKELLASGLIETLIPVAGDDPEWDIKLVAYIRDAWQDKHPVMSAVADALHGMRINANEYKQAPARERRSLLLSAFGKLQEVSVKIFTAFVTENGQTAAVNLKVPRFRPEQIFYEDTRREIDIMFNKARLEPLITKADSLFSNIPAFKTDKTHEDLLLFFLNRYGKESNIPLLQFYEAYSREQQNINAAGTGIMAALQDKWKDAFMQLVDVDLADGTGELHFSAAHLQAANEKAGYPVAERSNARGAFIQFFEEEIAGERTGLKAVINEVFRGYGKLLSRFLPFFDASVLKEQRDWNTRLSAGKLYVENKDNSHFNVNCHLPLMEYETQYAGGAGMLEEERQVKLSDLSVRYNEEDHRLQLYEKERGKIVEVFDLGMQTLDERSGMYQFLDKFNNANYFPQAFIVRCLHEACLRESGESLNAEKILVLPRIVYEQDVILRRKCWVIPGGLVPLQSPQMSDFDYYLLVNQWRSELGIMKDVFIAISHTVPDTGAANSNRNKPGKDDYKPQYINFFNPVAIRVFARIASKVNSTLRISEMLPTGDQMISAGGNKTVSEYVVQWYQFHQ